MKALANPNHELFCHCIARGNNPTDCYVVAGYPRDPDAAKRLMAQPLITERIQQLIPIYREVYATAAKPDVTAQPKKKTRA